MDFTDATILVTGANRGQGLAFAERLAREPLAHLLLGMRTPDPALCPQLPNGGARACSAVQVDISSRAQVEQALAAIAEVTGVADGGVDVLINNAGLLEAGLLERQDPDRIDAMLAANLSGPIHLTRLLLPGMLERGRGLIVNNASISGYAYLPGASTYAATKAGIVAFSEALRRELCGTGVHVMHLVTPRIETDMASSMDAQYDGLVDTSSFASTTPEAWADKVVAAMRKGDHIVGPGGVTAVTKLASRLPAGAVDAIARRLYTPPSDR
jgi:short-subunit dehydrogenase